MQQIRNYKEKFDDTMRYLMLFSIVLCFVIYSACSLHFSQIHIIRGQKKTAHVMDI
jgi:hypothetical protein